MTRKSGRLLVTAGLVNVATGARLWSKTYDRPAADILFIQDEIASDIVNEGVRMRLTNDERRQLRRNPTDDPAAYELYLRGVHTMEKATEEDYLAGRDLLRQAIARDQGFALAYVAVASTYSAMALDGFERPDDAFAQVTLNVRRALDFDPDLPDAHSEAASALFYFQWDWAASEQEWKRALQSRGGGIVPDFLSAYATELWALGRADEAVAMVRKARALDPLSSSLMLEEAGFLLKARHLDEAASLYEKIIRTEPGEPRAYFGLAEVRFTQERFDEAIDACRRAYKASGDDSLATVFSTAHGAEGYQLGRESGGPGGARCAPGSRQGRGIHLAAGLRPGLCPAG